jgi:SAM-dependent methyltransferase
MLAAEWSFQTVPSRLEKMDFLICQISFILVILDAMQNRDQWKPSKYVLTPNGWRGSLDSAQVTPASRLITDIVARQYDILIKKHASGKLLDHGCGQAPLFGIYRDYVDEVIAVDWPNSLHRTIYMDEACDLNHRMPFPDETFDTIISSDVLEHLWNPVDIMQDLARVLKPGGKLILNTPFNYWIHEAPHDYFRWTRFAIEGLGERAGLTTLERVSCGGSREVLADLLMKMTRSRRGAKGLDKLFRASKFVSIDRTGDGPFTLGNVAVLTKSARTPLNV